MEAYDKADLEDEINELRADNEAKDAEIAGLKSDIQCMVDKAAANKLDGYRELGQKCVDAEARADAAEKERDAARWVIRNRMEPKKQ